jgi:LmbE family N-acetylglucosaminyl deacetylase
MRVLAVGAHPIDIEMGCGGSLLAHRDRGDEIHLLVMAGPPDRRSTAPGAGARARDVVIEQELAAARLGASLHWGGFDDGAVPAGRESIAAVESVLVAAGCDLVYSPVPDDTHQDHRATADAVLATSRRSLQLLCYESPSSLHFDPVLFVDLAGRVAAKLELVGVHRTQLSTNDLVSPSAVAAQARHRGAQARVQHAEGFQTHRFVWELAPAPAPGDDSHAPWGARVLLGDGARTSSTSGEVA